jgi:hypothetical protein
MADKGKYGLKSEPFWATPGDESIFSSSTLILAGLDLR